MTCAPPLSPARMAPTLAMSLPTWQSDGMLYALYDATAAAMYPARIWARSASIMLRGQVGPDYLTWPARAAVAWADVADDVLRPRGKPEWNIKTVRNGEDAVTEEVVLDLPFVRLLRFAAPGRPGSGG